MRIAEVASGPAKITGQRWWGKRGRGLMWVLVVLAVNAHLAFSIPGYSSEQTCSAKGKEIIAIMPHKKGGSWVYHCVKPE